MDVRVGTRLSVPSQPAPLQPHTATAAQLQEQTGAGGLHGFTAGSIKRRISSFCTLRRRVLVRVCHERFPVGVQGWAL